MRKCFRLTMITLLLICCSESNHITPEEDSHKETFNLEGSWYVSARSEDGVSSLDSIKYDYDEDIYGYVEISLKLVPNEENYYFVSIREKLISQKPGEADEEYEDRITNKMYSSDELYIYNVNPGYDYWFISNNDIFIPWEGKKYKGFLLAKIVNKSHDTFTIASTSNNMIDLILDPTSYPYYITFKRIR